MCSFKMTFINIFMTTCASRRTGILVTLLVSSSRCCHRGFKWRRSYIAQKYKCWDSKNNEIAFFYFAYMLKHKKQTNSDVIDWEKWNDLLSSKFTIKIEDRFISYFGFVPNSSSIGRYKAACKNWRKNHEDFITGFVN